MDNGASVFPGALEVFVSARGGHSAEFWAERMVDRMMSVADTAPQPIRDQAVAFKARLYDIALFYVKEAMKSSRSATVFEISGK